ncbi:uncharacterized protein LOC105439703 [Strongylocentrotus purpuratus]|uniref:B box-type domain-containing protein n=1 Tax=Strongylocentrotus purpuratus TaxID=7668 RepID=A0A7M7HKJ7_STRPU|nr:uncharacterized protein LOC105439703 [Strongylocentrotus purpuratus]|eukprot:XP_011667278.1 PREDICTED: uncharacterized protein LOC105439703 [Strongylocentrotus purpuratus]
MASGFCRDDTCEEDGCNRRSKLVYSVSERRRLCQGCASEKATGPTQQSDAAWTCRKHCEPIKFFCVQHNEVICQSCATVAHQKPCDLKDVDDVVTENREKLDDILPSIKSRVPVLQKHMKTNLVTSNDIHDHFDTVETQIRAHVDVEKEAEKNKAKEKNLAITEAAERKIREIHKERDEQLKHSMEELEFREQEVDKKFNILLGELNEIRGAVAKEMGGIIEKSKYVLEKLNESLEGIEHVLMSDQELCVRTKGLLRAANDVLQTDTETTSLQRVATTALEVKFFKRPRAKVGAKNRIDGFRGGWTLVDTIDVPQSVELPGLVGCVGEGAVSIRDKQTGDLYLTNLKTKTTDKIAKGTVDTIVSCVSIDDKTTLCGKVRKGAFSDCIGLYDADWQPINAPDGSQTQELVLNTKRVFVDVDSTGMILASDFMASDIHIISPSDLTRGFQESIVHTVPVKDKSTEGFRCLSSGDIVVKSGYGGLAVIDRSGEVKNFIQDYEWGCAVFSVDSLTDAIYVVHKDSEKMMYAVDQVCATSGGVFRKILEYPMSDSKRNTSTQRCAVTPAGILITFNGDRLFLFKKSFIP